jgi:hypothetical protein
MRLPCIELPPLLRGLSFMLQFICHIKCKRCFCAGDARAECIGTATAAGLLLLVDGFSTGMRRMSEGSARYRGVG